MASWSIHSEVDEDDFVSDWLQESRGLNPSDWRTHMLFHAYGISHHLARWVLKNKKRGEADPLTIQPFMDVDLEVVYEG